MDPIKNEPAAPALIILSGFMGTGKSATGEALAAVLGRTFLDTDTVIEKCEGKSVDRIFKDHGESHFRKLEAALVKELAERDGLVVATGGGMLLDSDNLDTLSSCGPVYLLEASPETIASRLKGDATRPLLKGSEQGGSLEDRIRDLLKERASAYANIEHRIDTTGKDPEEVALQIAGDLNPLSHSIPLPYPAGALPSAKAKGKRSSSETGHVNTSIEIGRGLLSSLGARLAAMDLNTRAFVLIPENVRRHHMHQVADSLTRASIPFEEIVIRDRDSEKTLDQANELIGVFARNSATRDSVVIAVGGGVTGDLGGFAASIYMRGMPCVQVPTTLLAQVDASMGGKTAVNHKHAKNLVGTFYPAHLVLSDPCTLRTLPMKEIANGMAEAVKTAIIGDPDLYGLLEGGLSKKDDNKLGDMAFLEECVLRCTRVKADIVRRDPFEKNERRLLNLGHTIGHAFEAMDEYRRYSHGQAVSLGLLAVLRIALARKMAEATFVDDTFRILESCGLPTVFPKIDKSTFLQSLNLDKKKLKGKLHFILPERPGSCVIVDDVTETEIFDAISA